MKDQCLLFSVVFTPSPRQSLAPIPVFFLLLTDTYRRCGDGTKIDSASLCSQVDRHDNPIPTRFLAPIDCNKILAGACLVYPDDGRGFEGPKKKTIVGLLVFRVPGFLPSRPDWVPPHSNPQESVAPPPRGEPHSHAGEVVGGWPNSDDEKDTLVL